MTRFWKRAGRAGEPALSEPLREPLGYWEARLLAIGARVDGMGEILHELTVSIAAGEVWLTALASNETRGQPEWDVFVRRIEGVGAEAPSGSSRAGAWSAALTAIGRTLDRDSLMVREPCIQHQDSHFLVTALVEHEGGWRSANWTLTEQGDFV